MFPAAAATTVATTTSSATMSFPGACGEFLARDEHCRVISVHGGAELPPFVDHSSALDARCQEF